MTILGIDSATGEASVALVEDDALVAEQRHAGRSGHSSAATKTPSNHSEILLPLIDSLLARCSVSLKEISGISVSLGPGSFTGLRIGLATAMGLAYESGVALVGVPTLLANARRLQRSDALVGSLLDARRDEVYCALFRIHDRRVTRITKDALVSVDTLVDLWTPHCAAEQKPLLLLGDGAKAHEQRLCDSFPMASVVADGSLASIAAEVAKLGGERLTQESARECAHLTPIYLRSAAAEKKRQAVVTR